MELSSKKSKIIAVAVGLLIVALIIGLFISQRNTESTKDMEVFTNAETSGIEWLEAELDLYYLENGQYPVDYSILEEYIVEADDTDSATENKELLTSVEDSLDNLEYKVRGDGEAYQLTYTSDTGEMVTKEGNYREDFN